VLNCPHHISWIVPVPGGLHQCILCQKVVGPADVSPKVDDLPEEFGRRWREHEARREAAPAAGGTEAPAGKAPAGGSR
jgi:hypothetical protein